jgi:hypothetical protein
MKTLSLVFLAILPLISSHCSALDVNSNGSVDAPTYNASTFVEPDIRMPEASAVFNTLWPTEFKRWELSDTALAKMNAYIDDRITTKSTVELEMVFQNTIDVWHKEWTTDLARLSVATFSDYPVPEPMFVLGTDQQFMIDELLLRDREAHPVGGVCGHVGELPQGCAYGGTVWKGLELGPAGSHTGAGYIPHEYFHLVQDNLDPGPGGQTLPPGDPFYRPIWFIEGSAEFVGPALVNYAGLGRYVDNHPWFSNYKPAEDTAILAHFESFNGGYGSYDYGRLATEYIVANVGVEGLVNVWVYLGEGDPFDVAFSRSLGISIPEFYKLFDIIAVNLAEDGIELR